MNTDNFSVCFPYGTYNHDTINLLKKYKVKFALTVKVGAITKRNLSHKLYLPRYDAHDF